MAVSTWMNLDGNKAVVMSWGRNSISISQIWTLRFLGALRKRDMKDALTNCD